MQTSLPPRRCRHPHLKRALCKKVPSTTGVNPAPSPMISCMTRFSLRWFRSGQWLLTIAVGLASLVGCSESGSPARRNSSQRPQVPPYVYPEDPPLVDRAQLRRLITTLNADRTAIWVMGDIDADTEATTRTLTDHRDRLRASHFRIIGLYFGPPQHWSRRVLPMLRRTRANFICAVAAGASSPTIARWLTGVPNRPSAGIYIIDRNQAVVGEFASAADQIPVLVRDVTEKRIAWGKPIRPASTSLVGRFRLIELTTGKIRAKAEVETNDPASLADEATAQLIHAYTPAGIVAVLPLRCSSKSVSGGHELATAVGDRLARQLKKHGCRKVVAPEPALEMLQSHGFTPATAEFNPTSLGSRLGWTAIVVGYVDVD